MRGKDKSWLSTFRMEVGEKGRVEVAGEMEKEGMGDRE